MKSPRLRASAALLFSTFLIGCTTQRLPTYAPASDADALRLIGERAEHIRSVQSTATITLKSTDRSVTLDGAILAERPGRLRLRAWKLGQAVFDLTTNEEGAWQYVGREEARGQTPVTRAVIERFTSLLLSSAPQGNVELSPSRSAELLVRRPGESNTIELLTYDRATLTLSRLVVLDERGVERFRLDLSKYTLVDGVAWPMRVRATSGQGVIEIRFEDVSLNQPLPQGAFTPPARAERLP